MNLFIITIPSRRGVQVCEFESSLCEAGFIRLWDMGGKVILRVSGEYDVCCRFNASKTRDTQVARSATRDNRDHPILAEGLDFLTSRWSEKCLL